MFGWFSDILGNIGKNHVNPDFVYPVPSIWTDKGFKMTAEGPADNVSADALLTCCGHVLRDERRTERPLETEPKT